MQALQSSTQHIHIHAKYTTVMLLHLADGAGLPPWIEASSPPAVVLLPKGLQSGPAGTATATRPSLNRLGRRQQCCSAAQQSAALNLLTKSVRHQLEQETGLHREDVQVSPVAMNV